MDSKKLSARKKQPGHDRTFLTSESNFVEVLRAVCPANTYRVVKNPTDLSRILAEGRFGVRPEASLEYIPTGRKMYFEVKKQGPYGNAEERACKHHTVQFYRTLAEHTGYNYHAYCTVMCESLAADERYVLKHPAFFAPDHYVLWLDYEPSIIEDYVETITKKFLAGRPTLGKVPE